MSATNRPAAVRSLLASPPQWLSIRAPASVENIPDLHPGELEAISLARELNADLLLMDDSDGRRAAAARNPAVTGILGVLGRAADQRLLDLADAFERLKRTDFWISHQLLDGRLQLHLRRRQP